MRRVDIKTGFICNNNCVFCVQADNKCTGNRTFEEIKNNLLDCKDRCQMVTFTGGEVTIRKDFFKLINIAKKIGYQYIQIQSNGRMFYSLDFCKKAIVAGASEFALALHGYCANQHDSLTNAKGSFKQITMGIKNLRKLNSRVVMNTVVVKDNYKDLEKIAKLFVELDVHQFQFAFVHAMGNAWTNYEKVVPKMSEIMPYVKKGLDVGISANIKVMTEAIPLCMMKGYENYIAEKIIPETEIRGKDFQNTNDFTAQRKTDGKIKFSQCKECRYYEVCEGPWNDYPLKMGSDEFIPVK
ncbi:MAG: radical SAM protein [Candidatus Woesearchaeota archaeon]